MIDNHLWEDAYELFDAGDAGYVFTTGAIDRNMAVNLYDVAGNCNEFVMEVNASRFNGGRSLMGDHARAYADTSMKANFCDGLGSRDDWNTFMSFRPTLFVIGENND